MNESDYMNAEADADYERQIVEEAVQPQKARIAELEAEAATLRAALEDITNQITSSRRISIGSIGNVYEAQVSIETAERLRKVLAAYRERRATE